ncbi:unnamed protein product [Mycena citricolor]|nr:unnamed protein product [Mycena citricolor]
MSDLQTESEAELPVHLGDSVMVPSQHCDEARAIYESLKKSGAGNGEESPTTRRTLAYLAYALGDTAECLAHLGQLSDVATVGTSGDDGDRRTATLKVTAMDPTTSWTISQLSTTTTGPDGESIDAVGLWSLIEVMRSVCLYGMAKEKLGDVTSALSTYLNALPLVARPPPPFAITCELWRWTEMLLWRGVVLAALTRDEALWRVFELYATLSAGWPASFRAGHRCVVATLHLRACVLTKNVADSKHIVDGLRVVLAASTRFPKAGERNTRVEDFVDLIVAVWEVGGGEPGWIIEHLWWATRLTFNSHRIMRHLTRLLTVSGDTNLAKETLLLYVQIVSKAAQTGLSEDADTDTHFVQTLVSGARMLCKIGDVVTARTLIKAVRSGRLDPSAIALVASVDLAEGVSCLVAGQVDEAHAFFVKAVDGNPGAASHYHLAMTYAWPGATAFDLEKALANAGLAVERDPGEVRHWHLLGLLLAASEQWKAADEILEHAEALPVVSPAIGIEGLPVTEPVVDMLLMDEMGVPPSDGLLMAVQDHPPASRAEMFEHALQLRMTHAVLTERVEGPEGAESKWLEVFQWIAEQRGLDIAHVSKDSEPREEDSQPVPPPPIPIMIEPATPDESDARSSVERDPTTGKKKMQQMLKNRVHQGQARISTISRRVRGHHGNALRRTLSTPDFHAVFKQTVYQASSIHSRRKLGLGSGSGFNSGAPSVAGSVLQVSPPPPSPSLSPVTVSRESRLESDLWLMSAATFRRLGKIEQAKGAIQEAEVQDATNPGVWVQLGLYHQALGQMQHAVDALQKALWIDTECVAAAVGLAAVYLADKDGGRAKVDMVAGMLAHLVCGRGRYIPEVWYFLGKAYACQSRMYAEKECLSQALRLAEQQSVRELRQALGLCF